MPRRLCPCEPCERHFPPRASRCSTRPLPQGRRCGLLADTMGERRGRSGAVQVSPGVSTKFPPQSVLHTEEYCRCCGASENPCTHTPFSLGKNDIRTKY